MTFKQCSYIYVKNSKNGKDPKQHEGGKKLKCITKRSSEMIICRRSQ